MWSLFVADSARMNWPNPAASTNSQTCSGNPLYSSNEFAGPPCPFELGSWPLSSFQNNNDQDKKSVSVHVHFSSNKQSIIQRHTTSRSQLFKGVLPVDLNCAKAFYQSISSIQRHTISRIKLLQASYGRILKSKHPTVDSSCSTLHCSSS